MIAPPPALGFAEVPFLSITALVADAMVKAADVHLLGIETTGNENLQIRIQGGVSSVQAAGCRQLAIELGSSAVIHCLTRPEDSLTR